MKTMLDMGAALTAGTPAEFSTLIADDYAKWQKVIREAAIKVERALEARGRGGGPSKHLSINRLTSLQ